MAITLTTLAQAVTSYATRFSVASTANVNSPLYSSGSDRFSTEPSYLYCEKELMFVTGVPFSGVVRVRRGQLGTVSAAHANGTVVAVALASDVPLVSNVIASGTATLGTAQINSNASATLVTVAAPGVLTTDNIVADFNGDPTGGVGYQPGAMLTIIKYPTVGNVNFLVVNNTASAITPVAVTLNWMAVRAAVGVLRNG